MAKPPNKQEIKDLTDQVKFLEAALANAAEKSNKIYTNIRDMAVGSVDLKNIFNELVETIDDLPKGLINGQDLQKAMLKDAKLFAKVQKESTLLSKKVFKDGLKEIILKMKQDNKSKEERKRAALEYMELQERTLKNQEKEFLLMKRQAEQSKKIQLNFSNINDTIDKLESTLRKPASTIDGMFANMGAMPQKIADAHNKFGGFGGMIKAAGASMKGLLSTVGLLAIAFTAILGPIILLWKAFKSTYDFIDQKVLPAQASLNRELGNTGATMKVLSSQAVSTGVRFEQLGLSFAEGAGAVQTLASSMKTVTLPKETLELGLKLSEYVGMGAENAGKLMMAFDRTGSSVQDLDGAMKKSERIAYDYGVPVNQLRKDMGDNIGLVQRFGVQNIMQFSKSAAVARSYGLSIGQVNNAFGKTLDTFEGSSNVAAKLNAMFGTQINSYKLMLETDSVKRMEMVTNALRDQGKSWDRLNTFEKNVITSTLQVSEEEAALALSTGKSRKEIQNKINARKKEQHVNKEWEKGLLNIKSTIVNLDSKVDVLMRSLADFVSELLGFGPAGNNAVKTGDKMGQMIDNISKSIKNATQEINVYRELWDLMFSPVSTHNAEKALDAISKSSQSNKEIMDIQSALSDSETRAILQRKLITHEGMTPESAAATMKKFEEMKKVSMKDFTQSDLQEVYDPGLAQLKKRTAEIKAIEETKKTNFRVVDNTYSPGPMRPGWSMGNAGKQTTVVHAHVHIDGKEVGKTMIKAANK